MKSYFFKKILKNEGWLDNVTIEVDDTGRISQFEPNALENKNSVINGFALPGFQNAHSHAFQYAMAGLAEVHDTSNKSDNFWSWREAMYRLALSVNPDQIEAIATQLYCEMVRHGYTNVAEFHYIHHDKNGKPYNNLAEMGSRMVAAAKTAGINITLIPIFYQKGGFGKDPLEGQKRFISSTTDDYLKLLESSEKACSHYSGANISLGIHSMRGVDATAILEVARSGPQDIPFHIHIAEQLKEIEDCTSYLSRRPVEWLLENIEVTDRFHLVHATHLTLQETIGIAKSGANVILCPSTEGNLGDGIFPLIEYQKHQGTWSIGTDSHIGINPLEELRLLDYGQRLISHQRDTFSKENGDSGQHAIEMATIGGRKAMNNKSSKFFKVGEPFNAAIFKGSSPLLSTAKNKNLSSAILYTANISDQWGTIINGNLKTEDGNHILSGETQDNFIKTILELGNR
jgi:formimidoylglutamate deiminase